ncbi:Ribosomal protein L11 methyltransferase [Sesamum alatum]|uniref:ETFB lysine methyltransferase n=1 Tax=Sesamum alatum TaxID=300844 RepID=A0AAE1YZH0_9LAMI|nr:Ribosomal protein L11 methyltransferase [Sesamum alatum]
MSLALSLLRSHFFKHLTCCNSATTFFSFCRRIHCLPPTNRFSSVPSAKAARQQQLSKLNITAVNCSTLPLHNGTVTSHDAFSLPYLSVRICCPRHVADMLSESLMCFGASSTTIDEQDSHETGEEIWISSTFDIDQDVKDCISRAADSVGLKEIPDYKVEMNDHTDWIKQSQESFHPVEITEGLWVVPEWRNPPDLQAINIVLNPGLAFGTGEHPTTKLCLLLLRRLVKGGEYFLDYGTGSGVLAIAALKFGADLSVGFDIEPQAITSARHNAALNNIGPEKLLLSLVPSKNGPQFENECPYEGISSQDLYNSKIIAEKDKYDVVIANILLYPLLDLAERIISYAKPGAVVAVSGIISEQVPTVVEHYSQFLEDINVSTMDDWACITGSKKTEPCTT